MAPVPQTPRCMRAVCVCARLCMQFLCVCVCVCVCVCLCVLASLPRSHCICRKR